MKAAVLMLSMVLCAANAWACEGHDHAHTQSNNVSASTTEYQQSMERMHKDMTITYTGDADVDFVRGMIPHHQAAVDMAKTQLKYGKNPELRALSTKIIQAQEAEIKQLEAWLQHH